ncbi:MAG: hypothetical protein K1X29_10055 [Bdellovibrionales bacterium]|nr:hypothetical protein [Bdellovibrionales bacterium]
MNYKLRSYLKLFWLTFGLVFFLYEGGKSLEAMAEPAPPREIVITKRDAEVIMQKALLSFLIKRILGEWLILDTKMNYICSEIKRHSPLRYKPSSKQICKTLKSLLLQLDQSGTTVKLSGGETLSTLTDSGEFLTALLNNFRARLENMLNLRLQLHTETGALATIQFRLEELIITTIALATIVPFLLDKYGKLKEDLWGNEPLTFPDYESIFKKLVSRLGSDQSLSSEDLSGLFGESINKIKEFNFQFWSQIIEQVWSKAIEQSMNVLVKKLLEEVALDLDIFSSGYVAKILMDRVEISDEFIQKILDVYRRSYFGGPVTGAGRSLPCGLILRPSSAAGVR